MSDPILQNPLAPLDLSGSQRFRFVLVCAVCTTRTYQSDDLYFFQGIDSQIIAKARRRKCPYCGNSGLYMLFVENR